MGNNNSNSVDFSSDSMETGIYGRTYSKYETKRASKSELYVQQKHPSEIREPQTLSGGEALLALVATCLL